MALDLCLDAAGGLIHAFDVVWFDRRFPGWGSFRVGTRSPEPRSITEGWDIELTAGLDHWVGQTVDRLPFVEARAIWLIDVCGLTYADAATEMGVGWSEVAATVAAARQRIRVGLAHQSDPPLSL